MDAFSKALPELSLGEVAWRMHFMIGSMTHVLLWKGHIQEATGGLCDASDREALMDYAVTFIAAGFQAPAMQLAARAERNG